MTPTTIGALLDAFDARVLAIVPSELIYRVRVWSIVDDIDKVSGGEIRKFYIAAEPPVAVTDGIFSPSAVEHVTTVRVYASYKNMRRREMTALAGEDGRQIWIDWDIRRDPIIPGLVSVVPTGFESEDDEQGSQWGAHTFEVRLMAPGVP